MRNVVITIVLFGLASINALAQDDSNCNNRNVAFRAGEEATYVLSYSWLFIWTDVGEVTFSVNSDNKFGQDALHLHVLGRSYPFYDRFFKVIDIYESWVDPVTLRPIYFNRDISEGGYTKENEYTFDWESSIVNARIRRRGRENRFYQIPVEPCTIDVVTAIYITRNLDFSKATENTSFPITVLLDKEIYNVKYTFLGREEKRIKSTGTFNAIKFRVDLIAGDIFKDGQFLYVWVTDDQNKLPLYIESPIRVGSVRASLSKWEGLKFPLKSKVQ